MSQSKTTTDHEEIKRWVEQRNGKPAAVKAVHRKNDPGILRIDFPGGAGEESLDTISWDEWFAKFDETDLAFLHQDKTSDGRESRFFKLVSREG
jgi:hypothetical protein